MALFQKAPASPEDLKGSEPLEIPPAEVAEMDEAEWYAKAYRGDDVPQLTLRAIGMGSLLGFLLAWTNLYIGLKTGWHLGVAITACILSYAIWQTMVKAGLAKTQMTILENNCMQSTASAAGYSTGGTFVSSIAALLMISNVRYYSFKDLNLKERVPFIYIVAIVGLFVLVSFDPPKVAFSVFLAYMVSGPVITLLRRRRKRHGVEAGSSPADDPQ